MASFLFVVDVSVPEYAKPQYVNVIYPSPDALDERGRPVGAFGYPHALLWWDRISLEAAAWWQGRVDGRLSVDVSRVILIDTQKGGAVNWEDVTYLGYSDWSSGILHELSRDASGHAEHYNKDEKWFEGRAEIKITELGRPLD